jgi:hypothetical protein
VSVTGPTVSGTADRYVTVYTVTGFREGNDRNLQFLDHVAADYVYSVEEIGYYSVVFDAAHTGLALRSREAHVIDDILFAKKHIFER